MFRFKFQYLHTASLYKNVDLPYITQPLVNSAQNIQKKAGMILAIDWLTSNVGKTSLNICMYECALRPSKKFMPV